MGAAKGGQNAKGHKGKGGRPSAYVERTEAEWLKDAWAVEKAILALEDKIASGVYSVRDRFLLMALKGNDKMIKLMGDKILPDLIDLATKGKSLHENLTDAQLARIASRRRK